MKIPSLAYKSGEEVFGIIMCEVRDNIVWKRKFVFINQQYANLSMLVKLPNFSEVSSANLVALKNVTEYIYNRYSKTPLKIEVQKSILNSLSKIYRFFDEALTEVQKEDEYVWRQFKGFVKDIKTSLVGLNYRKGVPSGLSYQMSYELSHSTRENKEEFVDKFIECYLANYCIRTDEGRFTEFEKEAKEERIAILDKLRNSDIDEAFKFACHEMDKYTERAKMAGYYDIAPPVTDFSEGIAVERPDGSICQII